MCSRYFTEDKRSGMRTEIHPCDEAAVFASGSDGRTEASMMYWGVRALKGNADSLVFNARSETVSDKVMFRESFLHRRCVVPAAGFYEWNRAGEKAVFEPENKETLYFAGVYRMEKGVPRFVILTTQANESMVKIHDRMPLIIKEEQIEEWLGGMESCKALLGQVPEKLKKSMEYEQQAFEFN